MSGDEPRPVQDYRMRSDYQNPLERTARDSKGPGRSNVTPVLLAAIAIVIIIVAGGIILAVWFFGQITSGDEDETEVFESDVVIADGGHFRHALTVGWGDRVTVNITITSISGGTFDVFLMDEDQYENAYGNASTGSFSVVRRWENVTSVAEVLDSGEIGPDLLLVIDNSDVALLPADAVPEGTVSMSVSIITTYRWIEVF